MSGVLQNELKFKDLNCLIENPKGRLTEIKKVLLRNEAGLFLFIYFRVFSLNVILILEFKYQYGRSDFIKNILEQNLINIIYIICIVKNSSKLYLI